METLMQAKPTGNAWRNWKKARIRERIRLKMNPLPGDWDAEWALCSAQASGSVGFIKPTDAEVTARELVDWRKKQFVKKAAHEASRALIRVQVPISGPYGILHFGDPHVDDDGTDWVQLDHDIELVKNTPGLFAANIGDSRNNWVGRLARLYADQSTSAKDGIILADYFLRQLKGKWVYIIGGNHDAWSGADDPLQWITEQINALYQPSEARIQIDSPSGASVIINARHDFKGSSQWNNAHPVMKAAMLGVRDDIFVCGHKHLSGYGVVKSPDNGNICHCLQISSYKVYDRFAREKGFRDQHISPCAVTVIDPNADPINRVQVFWDSTRGAEYLSDLRRRSPYAMDDHAG